MQPSGTAASAEDIWVNLKGIGSNLAVLARPSLVPILSLLFSFCRCKMLGPQLINICSCLQDLQTWHTWDHKIWQTPEISDPMHPNTSRDVNFEIQCCPRHTNQGHVAGILPTTRKEHATTTFSILAANGWGGQQIVTEASRKKCEESPV